MSVLISRRRLLGGLPRHQGEATKPTNIKDPEYFHKVVDCQHACPAHTPVPEYIRLIAAERYGEAYMVNWESNVFPGVLGRTCDRPCNRPVAGVGWTRSRWRFVA